MTSPALKTRRYRYRTIYKGLCTVGIALEKDGRVQDWYRHIYHLCQPPRNDRIASDARLETLSMEQFPRYIRGLHTQLRFGPPAWTDPLPADESLAERKAFYLCIRELLRKLPTPEEPRIDVLDDPNDPATWRGC